MRVRRPLAYWSLVGATAATLVTGVSGSIDARLLELPDVRRGVMRSDGYALATGSRGEAIINAGAVKPGGRGRGRVVIRNAGMRSIRRLTVTQDRLRLGGMSRALQLQVADLTTGRCLYPATRTRCRAWRAFDARRTLQAAVIPARRGRRWLAGERHVVEVRWRLRRTSPNTDQARRASFRLVWRAEA